MNKRFFSLLGDCDFPNSPVSNLPVCFTARLAKPNDKKDTPIQVVEIEDYIKMGVVVRQLVRKVNYLLDKIQSPIKSPFSAKEIDDMIGEALGVKGIKEEDVGTIMQWHKETFPLASCMGQLEKWKEERKEFNDAISVKEQIEELADMFIVACAIMRFNVPRGAACLTEVCALREHFNFNFLLWKDAVNKKMAKNRARKWKYMGNGNYHHIKETED